MNIIKVAVLMLLSMGVFAEAKYTPSEDEVQAMYENAKAMMERGSISDAYPVFLEAAEFGNVLAATTLATLNASGLGVPENQTQALAWFKVAATLGYSLAAFASNSIADTLTEAQVKTASKEAERILKLIAENRKDKSENR